MITDIDYPTRMLRLTADVIDEIGATLRRQGWGEGWGEDPDNPDLPVSVTWSQGWLNSRTVIEYSGQSNDWACDVEAAVRKTLPQYGQRIVQSSFHETESTFSKVLEASYMKVVIENGQRG